MDLFKTLRNAWKVPELRNKLIYTLWMFLFIRIGVSITVPGVDRAALAAANAANANSGFVNQFMSMITGGANQDLALFALGVGPYITASIIMQLLQVAISKLEELAKEGEEGRKKNQQVYTLCNTWFSSCTIMGYGIDK